MVAETTMEGYYRQTMSSQKRDEVCCTANELGSSHSGAAAGRQVLQQRSSVSFSLEQTPC